MKQEVLKNQFWTEQEFSISNNIFYGNEKYMLHAHTYYEFFMIDQRRPLYLITLKTED
jgi:hypothetical protein